MKKLTPTRDQILVEPIKGNTDTVRGILIPEAHRDNQPSIDCMVLAKGPKATDDVKIGDRVIIHRHSGIDVNAGGRLLKLMPSNEILAIIE